MKFFLTSLLVFVAMFILNILVHGFIIGPAITRPLLGDIVRSETDLNLIPMLVNYLILSFAFTYLNLKWNYGKKYSQAGIFGFIVGTILFLNFGLSAMFILPRWPLPVAIIDAIATGFIYAALSILIHFAAKRWKIKI